jgi:hypothetical protein
MFVCAGCVDGEGGGGGGEDVSAGDGPGVALGGAAVAPGAAEVLGAAGGVCPVSEAGEGSCGDAARAWCIPSNEATATRPLTIFFDIRMLHSLTVSPVPGTRVGY